MFNTEVNTATKKEVVSKAEQALQRHCQRKPGSGNVAGDELLEQKAQLPVIKKVVTRVKTVCFHL